MKSIYVVFMVCAILLGLAGCDSAKLPDPGFVPLDMFPGETHSGYEGVEIQIDGLNWHDGNGQTSLAVVWNNRTQYEVTYGASFAIERLDGEEWVSCAIPEDPVFIAIAYLLSAGQTTKELYTLTDMFDISSPGIYRFKTDCIVADNARQGTRCELVAEFTVGIVRCTEEITQTVTEVEWAAQYIRTNGYQDGAKFPRVEIIKSVKELADYYNANNGVFGLDYKEKVYSDTTAGFLDACDQYDTAFFEKNYLIFVLLEEGSGSVRHEVRGVTQTENKKIAVSIDRKVPDVGTSDMAEWHIILELSREVIVETTNDVLVYLDGNLAWNGCVVESPKHEAAFKTPPEGTVRTPERDITLTLAGYDWTVLNGDGTATATIADQVSRPLPKDSLMPVVVDSKYADTVYAPISGRDTCAPTNSLGYLLKVNWETDPSSVTYTCWPETVWEQSNVPAETVVSQDGAFYAKQGGYVYEILAVWEDTGAGYYGSANYYIYITDAEDSHEHMTALQPQTVAKPVTGYCGNTQTKLYIGDREYSFMYGYSVTLTDLLVNLDYDTSKVCGCAPQYRASTEFGLNYQIHLDYGFVRCDKGQADLTQEQIDTITEIVAWAETTNCQYPVNN